VITTECCGVPITADVRYCPKCGWECRTMNREEKGDEVRAVIVRAYDTMTSERWRAFEAYCTANNTAASLLSFAEYLASPPPASTDAPRRLVELELIDVFSERLYRILRHPPQPNSTTIGTLSQEETAIYDATRAALKAALLAQLAASAAPATTDRSEL
jgi:hypothetical protein